MIDKRNRRRVLTGGAVLLGSSLSQWHKPIINSVLLPAHAQASTPCSIIEFNRTVIFDEVDSFLPQNIDFEFIGDGCDTLIISPPDSSPDVRVEFFFFGSVDVIGGEVTFQNESTISNFSLGDQTTVFDLGLYTSPSGITFQVTCTVTLLDPSFTFEFERPDTFFASATVTLQSI